MDGINHFDSLARELVEMILSAAGCQASLRLVATRWSAAVVRLAPLWYRMGLAKALRHAGLYSLSGQYVALTAGCCNNLFDLACGPMRCVLGNVRPLAKQLYSTVEGLFVGLLLRERDLDAIDAAWVAFRRDYVHRFGASAWTADINLLMLHWAGGARRLDIFETVANVAMSSRRKGVTPQHRRLAHQSIAVFYMDACLSGNRDLQDVGTTTADAFRHFLEEFGDRLHACSNTTGVNKHMYDLAHQYEDIQEIGRAACPKEMELWETPNQEETYSVPGNPTYLAFARAALDGALVHKLGGLPCNILLLDPDEVTRVAQKAMLAQIL